MNMTRKPSWMAHPTSGKWLSTFSFACTVYVVLLLIVGGSRGQAGSATAPFARLDPADTPSGYLARLLLNEVPFPGEWAYESEMDSKTGMFQILWVLDCRIYHIPEGYTQREVAGVHSDNIMDVITGAGGRRQCEGFYRDNQGRYVTADRVEERINNLLRIANSGGTPGHFSALINHAQGLARAYFKGGIRAADRYAGLKKIGAVPVTGHAFSWMTDIDAYDPGGNFVTIPDADNGSLGGNRFFTLRKYPK
jgi:hypothetical protein